MCFKVFLFMAKETLMSAKILLPLSESKGYKEKRTKLDELNLTVSVFTTVD